MSNLRKKAVSSVIATILLVSLSIVAAAIVGTFIFPMVKQNSNFAPITSCIELRANPTITIKDACFNQQTNEVELTMTRNLNEANISSLSFIIKSDNDVKSFKCNSNCKNCQIIKKGMDKTYYFSFPAQSNLELTYMLNECEIKTGKVSQTC